MPPLRQALCLITLETLGLLGPFSARPPKAQAKPKAKPKTGPKSQAKAAAVAKSSLAQAFAKAAGL